MNKKLVTFGLMLVFLTVSFSGCSDLDLGNLDEVTQFSITAFNVEPSLIEQGQTANLSWTVMSAQSVTIDQGIGNVSNIGHRIIMPAETTTYTITAVNKTKTLTATTQIIVTEATENEEEEDDNQDDEDSDEGAGSGGEPGGSDVIIEEGDCADVHYIGRYASNNTVFDSSYEAISEKNGGSPLNIFVTTDKTLPSPTGYSNYTPSFIDGLLTRLIGKAEGETYTLEIPPSEAYGEQKLQVGDQFSSSSFALNTINPDLSLNQTLMVTELTDSSLSLIWVELDDYGSFTMPQIIQKDLLAQTQEDMILIPPPYFIWKGASEIIDYDENTVTIHTTPTKTENLFDSFEQIQYGFGENEVFSVFPDATTASYTETTITLTSDPEIGAEYTYSYSYFGQQVVMTYTVTGIDEETIDLNIETQGTTQEQTVARTLEFSRTYEFPRTYEDIPSNYQESLIGADLERAGYSLHDLAGETLIFEVSIEKVYKTST